MGGRLHKNDYIKVVIQLLNNIVHLLDYKAVLVLDDMELYEFKSVHHLIQLFLQRVLLLDPDTELFDHFFQRQKADFDQKLRFKHKL